jgi:superfamily I DNA and/or RNA helicase
MALDQEIQALNEQIDSAVRRWPGHVPTGPEYAETRLRELIEKRELSAPWADEEFTAARTELFLSALRLHQAFIRLESRTIRGNLSALMDILKGNSRPPHKIAEAAWQSLFLVVPVVSTTFASLSRLFGDLGRESLGWLFIDEAGQTTPQQAVGGIWRSRRTVVVGDPLQLEPVVTLSGAGRRALLRWYGLAPEWAPSRTSVQGVADRVGRHGTWLHESSEDSAPVWVGSPLRVHRRCDRPMFDICNQIAYGGLMIYGTQPRGRFPGGNAWLNVVSYETRNHWVPAEGQVLEQLLTMLVHEGAGQRVDPEAIRVISPFKAVADQAREIHRRVLPQVAWNDRVKWVGTVHTMQGREADVVILVLGTHPDRASSREWAANPPNLLNVAVSRARRRLYVIGNRDAWTTQRPLAVIADKLDRP